jgi:hypothetical protein
MGTSSVPIQSFAVDQNENKPTVEYKNEIKASTEANIDNTNQQLSEENQCYRSNSCTQAKQAHMSFSDIKRIELM